MAKRGVRPRFDLGGLLASWGMALLAFGMSALIAWAVTTAPSGPSRTRTGGLTQQFVRALPDSVQAKLGLVAAGVFALVGVLFVGLGIWSVIEQLLLRRRAR